MLATKKLNNIKKEVGRVNHIWIFDRSGSMSWVIKQLVEDMIELQRVLKPDDTLSVGWFSSEGEYNWLIKGYVVGSIEGGVEKLLRANNTSLNLTCFSEILISTSQVLQNLSIFSPQFSLIFFTDGYPVVSNYQQEENNIFRAIFDVAPDIDNSLLVGYGDYYNKPLLVRMAQAFNGALIHSSDLDSYKVQSRTFLENLTPMQPVDLDVDTERIYFTQKGMVTAMPVLERHTFVPTGVKEVFYETDRIMVQYEPPYEAWCAVAVIALQEADVEKAIEMLAKTGDVYLLDLANNAFTNQDFGQAENAIRDAIQYPAKRFLSGKDYNYLPADDAFCVLYLLELLQQDKNAMFYPYDPMFHYKRTGKKSKQLPGYPQFIKSDANPAIPLEDLVWHQTRANISIRCRINGVVDIGKNEVDLPPHFYTHIYRNYTIVKDGNLNVTMLPVSTSKRVFDVLKKHNLVMGKWESGKIYAVDLAKLPIINKVIARGYKSATALCERVMSETEVEAGLKVYRHFLKELLPEKQIEGYKPEQQIFLKERGITYNGYNPPTEDEPAQDYYYAKEFKVEVEGMKSLPSVKEVMEKMEDGKKLTGRQDLLRPFIADFQLHADDKIPWLQDHIESAKTELWNLRRYIQRAKFAVIVGKTWFDELKERECVFEGCSLSFKDNTKVEY
jgi:hypothetical protein